MATSQEVLREWAVRELRGSFGIEVTDSDRISVENETFSEGGGCPTCHFEYECLAVFVNGKSFKTDYYDFPDVLGELIEIAKELD